MSKPDEIEDKYLNNILNNISLSDLPGEEWKLIKDFENYALSSYGRVKSLERWTVFPYGSKRKEKEKNIIPSIIITVECKAENIKIKESDYSIGYNFASTINANFFIAVNLKETKIFHIKNEISTKKIEKLTEIPKAEILSEDSKICK